MKQGAERFQIKIKIYQPVNHLLRAHELAIFEQALGGPDTKFFLMMKDIQLPEDVVLLSFAIAEDLASSKSQPPQGQAYGSLLWRLWPYVKRWTDATRDSVPAIHIKIDLQISQTQQKLLKVESSPYLHSVESKRRWLQVVAESVDAAVGQGLLGRVDLVRVFDDPEFGLVIVAYNHEVPLLIYDTGDEAFVPLLTRSTWFRPPTGDAELRAYEGRIAKATVHPPNGGK